LQLRNKALCDSLSASSLSYLGFASFTMREAPIELKLKLLYSNSTARR